MNVTSFSIISICFCFLTSLHFGLSSVLLSACYKNTNTNHRTDCKVLVLFILSTYSTIHRSPCIHHIIVLVILFYILYQFKLQFHIQSSQDRFRMGLTSNKLQHKIILCRRNDVNRIKIYKSVFGQTLGHVKLIIRFASSGHFRDALCVFF